MAYANQNEIRERYSGLKSGFTFNYPSGTREDAGYILLARGNPYLDGEPSIELWDLNKQIQLYKWNFNINKIRAQTKVKTSKANSIYFLNPILLPDGQIVVTDIRPDGPLIKLSLKGEAVKINTEYKFHHSLDIDSQNS